MDVWNPLKLLSFLSLLLSDEFGDEWCNFSAASPFFRDLLKNDIGRKCGLKLVTK
jgi:hypothetical protein